MLNPFRSAPRRELGDGTRGLVASNHDRTRDQIVQRTAARMDDGKERVNKEGDPSSKAQKSQELRKRSGHALIETSAGSTGPRPGFVTDANGPSNPSIADGLVEPDAGRRHHGDAAAR